MLVRWPVFSMPTRRHIYSPFSNLPVVQLTDETRYLLLGKG